MLAQSNGYSDSAAAVIRKRPKSTDPTSIQSPWPPVERPSATPAHAAQSWLLA